uniref:G3BP stress granule assembly factor 2a n=1 Tax=Xiphophorus couchianus TaxID=32473 RepID=A0A3B5LZ66_9TELE
MRGECKNKFILLPSHLNMSIHLAIVPLLFVFVLNLFSLYITWFVFLLLYGSVANKFYVHNDIFCYEDEVFGDSEAELDEGKVVLNDYSPEPEPEPEQEPKVEEVKPEVEEKAIEEMEEKTPSPAPVESPPNAQEPAKPFSWASVTSKNLPPSGTVTSSGHSPHVLKATSSQPRVEAKQETQATPLRPRDQRTRDRPTFTQRGPRPDGVPSSESQTGKPHLSFVNKGGRDVESGDMDGRRIVRYPDSHQLFVGNLPHDIDEAELKEFFMTYGNVVELRINTKGVGGKLPNFGFVVFDDSDPVQRILGAKPIMFRGEVRLNVEEKKTRAVRERETRGGDDRRDMRRSDRGPGGPRGIVGPGMMRDGRGPPPRGALRSSERDQFIAFESSSREGRLRFPMGKGRRERLISLCFCDYFVLH